MHKPVFTALITSAHDHPPILSGRLFSRSSSYYDLKNIPQTPPFYIVGPTYVLGFAYVGYHVARGAVRSFRDWRELKRLPPVTAISRSDIEMMLGRFATNTYRRRFVRWLADRRITPTGTWPLGFSLSDRSDPAITDLARLEERWLGLDR